MNNDELFYVGQKAFIEKNGEVLILILPNGWIDFPGGKIQDGEKDFKLALRREVQEETGLEIEIGKPFYRWSFSLNSKHNVFLLGFICKYIRGEVILSHEHVGFKWVNKNNFQKYNDKREHFKALQEYFSLRK